MVNLEFEILDSVKLPLVQRFYKSHYPATKPKKNEIIVVARLADEIGAIVRFRPVETYQLLTGMVVHSQRRQQGIGHRLLDHCRQTQLTDKTYCFAFTWLTPFYQQHGFQITQSEHLPKCLLVLLERYQNSGKSLVPMKYVAEFSHI
jgi:N-acetylglutamate synthase-like GNAT family acetyltransferase